MRSIENIGQFFSGTREAGGKTLLELLGQQRLVVEHHRGIACYGDGEIIIKASYGLVSITGRNMRLCHMSREQLCIRGQIEEIKLTGRGQDGSLE